jgi:hypothetical protein
VSFDEQTGQIAAPVAANPSETLAEIFRTIFECGLHLGFLVILHADFPIVCIKPAGNEIVIVGIQLARPPLFVGKSVGESLVLQDAAAIRSTASGETWQTAVDVETCRAIEVAAFKVCRAQEIPHTDIHCITFLGQMTSSSTKMVSFVVTSGIALHICRRLFASRMLRTRNFFELILCASFVRASAFESIVTRIIS